MQAIICEAPITHGRCETSTRPEAARLMRPATAIQPRLREVASTMAPHGPVAIMPATAPTLITVPIAPARQPCASKRTPRNGPMPACMSAMKKLSASSAVRPAGLRPRSATRDSLPSPW
jgi:hypothetical protein